MSGTRRKPGRMAPFIGGLQTRWSELGYSDLAIRNMLKDVGTIGRWMQERDVRPCDL
ncbi:integrase, partial [Mycolicibacterium austroafricanum]